MTQPGPSPGLFVALLSLWVLVYPGLLIAPLTHPGAGWPSVLFSAACAVGFLSGTVYALFRLMRMFIDGAPDDPRLAVVQTLDGVKATWTLGAPRPMTRLAMVYGLALHGWLLMGTAVAAQSGDVPLVMILLYALILVLGAVPWVRQLARELRPAQDHSVHATVDRLRVTSDLGTTELSMHDLVASAAGETLQLQSGDTHWSGTCPDSHGRDRLLEALDSMAGRVAPAVAPEEPETLRRLRGQQPE